MALKDNEGEKRAQCLASKLNSNAFQDYMRMGLDDRKDYVKLVTKLRSGFKKGTLNRPHWLN